MLIRSSRSLGCVWSTALACAHVRSPSISFALVSRNRPIEYE